MATSMGADQRSGLKEAIPSVIYQNAGSQTSRDELTCQNVIESVENQIDRVSFMLSKR